MNKINIHLTQIEEGMSLLDQPNVQSAADHLKIVRLNGGTVYLCGNGGSHTTASHLANDLGKSCRIKAICLGDAVPTMLAYGNDDGWDRMYANALIKKITSNDALIGISCSGNSMNVVNALSAAKNGRALTIGLTGLSSQSKICMLELDVVIHASVPDIRVQEDLHSIICHAIVRALMEDE